MQLVEVRDLDGPNLFTLRPAIKLEVRAAPDERVPEATCSAAGALLSLELPAEPHDALRLVVCRLHELAGEPAPATGVRLLDPPEHGVVYYDWTWRAGALAVARAAFDIVSRTSMSDPIPHIREAFGHDRAKRDGPLWVRDDWRRVPTIGITGTNGKTTTTRLIAHIARSAGKHAGWSSSSGVYIDGQQVLDGDYTGPAGARRVLDDPAVEIAVLETARGGILLRGLAYESNDVGVFLNVSSDHLDMHGIERVETLAEVKSVVVRVTQPQGVVVLNADDPLVLAQRERVRAPILLTSQQPGGRAIREHVASGGRAVVSDGRSLWILAAGPNERLAELEEVPMTWGGAARHMVENALAGAAAALGIGFEPGAIRDGLRSFRSDQASNAGRLNVFRLGERVAIVDYAHNESGLEALLAFARAVMAPHGSLSIVVGTAGDRQDDVLRRLGRIASELADRVYVKANPRYLRGRPEGEVTGLIREGVRAAGAERRLAGVFPGERAAVVAALDASREGDALAIMCLEEQEEILHELRRRGAVEWTPAAR